MSVLRAWSVKTKLVLVTLLMAKVAIILADSALFMFDRHIVKKEMERSLGILARIASTNAAACLAFTESNSATGVLRALGQDPQVIGACLLGQDGTLVAEFHRGDVGGSALRWEVLAQPSDKEGIVWRERDYSYAQSVNEGGEELGKVIVVADCSELLARQRSSMPTRTSASSATRSTNCWDRSNAVMRRSASTGRASRQWWEPAQRNCWRPSRPRSLQAAPSRNSSLA